MPHVSGLAMQLTKQVGEYRVAAELARRGLLSAAFGGSVPHFDIVASGQHGGHIPVQVKAVATGNWQFDVRSFVDITFDGDTQVLGAVKNAPYPGLVYVFVRVDPQGDDDFFIVDWATLANAIHTGHKDYLAAHGGIRPRRPHSTHGAFAFSRLEEFRDKWDTILDRLPGPA